ACPVSPAFCNAANTSLSLNSPVTSKDFAPFVAVLPVTPLTPPSAVLTAFTHLAQHRCTPSICCVLAFWSVAPVRAFILIEESLLLPKYPAAISSSAAFCTVAVSGPVSVTVPSSWSTATVAPGTCPTAFWTPLTQPWQQRCTSVS